MTSAPARRRFPWGFHALVLVVIVVVAALPLIGVMISGFIAETNGCRLDEAGSYPCVIGGNDWGGLLAGVFVMGWLMLATIPIGGLVFIAWLMVMLVHWILWSRRTRSIK